MASEKPGHEERDKGGVTREHTFHVAQHFCKGENNVAKVHEDQDETPDTGEIKGV